MRATALATGGLAAGRLFTGAAAADPVGGAPPLGPVRVLPDDARYPELVRRGHKRFVGTPDYVDVVGTTEQVRRAVESAVRAGKRLAVRSGGHCLEDFVDSSGIRAVIDLSGLTQVYFDPERQAFAVEAGATLGEVYRRLFLGWNVTVPGGWCPRVGAGGHIAGGGYGVLSRRHGLVVDHLDAVEVVVVDASGAARTVIATRDPADPNHDLWWAHTGGGGGNFGIVTRYWLRTPGSTGTDPSRLLPNPPAMVLDFTAEWSWEGMDEAAFRRLAGNHARWCAENAAPGTPTDRFYAELILRDVGTGTHLLIGEVSGADADAQLDRFLDVLAEGVGRPVRVVRQWRPWLTAVFAGPDESKLYRIKFKSGYLREPFTDDQLGVIHRQLTRTDTHGRLLGSVGLSSYGGAINAVAPDATATAHRDAVIKLLYVSAWEDPAQDAVHVDWVREFYREVYADTGGVPDRRDGAYVNYPDVDLADPEVNRSGVPWHELYYKQNYARLSRAKARWDPLDVFRHALSVRPA
ncbi:FAD-binding oxidoreductase [Actinosynnema sp. NPDC059797]